MSEDLEVSKQTFLDADLDTKMGIAYDYLNSIHKHQCAQVEKCDVRFVKLEKRKLVDRGVAMVAGVFTGLAAWLGLGRGG